MLFKPSYELILVRMSEELLRAIEKVTGKPRAEGLREVLASYIERRMEECRKKIRGFEAKYGMSFKKFYERLGKDLPLDWEHEKDAFDWEAAITELEELKRVKHEIRRVHRGCSGRS